MTTHRTALSHAPAAGGMLLAASLLVGGCASTQQVAPVEPPPDPGYDNAALVQWASPRFATIQRDTRFVVARDDYRDLLIIEDETPTSRRTWLVTIPAGAPAGSRIVLGPASGDAMGRPVADAWLVEELRGGTGHAAPAQGVVEIDGRDDAYIGIAVSLEATTRPLDAGRAPAPIEFQASLVCDSVQLDPIAYNEMDRRGGLDPVLHDDREPPIWASMFDIPRHEPPRNRFSD